MLRCLLSEIKTFLFPRIRKLTPQRKLCCEAAVLVRIILTSYCEVYVMATISDLELDA